MRRDRDKTHNFMTRLTVPRNETLTGPEMDIYRDILQQHRLSTITVGVSHHVDEATGSANCFRFECEGECAANTLPIGHDIFCNTSMVECKPFHGISRQGCGGSDDRDVAVNRTALEMMKNLNAVKMRLLEFMREVNDNDDESNACSFECMPDELDTEGEGAMIGVLGRGSSSMDSRGWFPETPMSVGIYHAYTQGASGLPYSHRLFLVVSGGCTRLNLTYRNMVNRVGENMDAEQICESTETWFCRRANQRNSCMLLYDLAKKFSLNVHSITDTDSYEQRKVAVADTVTMHADIFRKRGSARRVCVVNGCCDPTRSKNGILYHLSPNQGYRLFQGAPGSTSGLGSFGNGFGMNHSGPLFPVAARKTQNVSKAFSSRAAEALQNVPKAPSSRAAEASPFVSYVDAHANLVKDDNITRYSYEGISDEYVSNLCEMGWNRDFGTQNIMPLSVVYVQQS